MKKLIFAIIIMAYAGTACQRHDAIKDNPLLKVSETPHHTPPFNEIKLEHYEPAIEYALAEARKETDQIINNTEAPTFENTIVALERSGKDLSRISTIFFATHLADTSDEMDAIAERIQNNLVEYSNDINLNPVLFEKVKTIYDNRATLSLDTEDAMLLEKTYKGFVRGGAGLNEANKNRLREISTELSNLELKFEQNVLAATNAFTLNIPLADSVKVKELPGFVQEGMAAEAKARGQEGWTVTLQAASYVPFLTYSSDRALKETLWRESYTRCMKGTEKDNREVIKRITSLRLEKAKLFGYPTYADYVLEERMAGNVETVNSFIQELITSTQAAAQKDVAALQEYATVSGLYGADFKMMPWDWSYISEKYKNAKYAISDEEIKPYLQLDKVKEGIFTLAEKLYGIRFVANPSIQVYHPDVTAYEAYEENGNFVGVIYMDFFPRESKRGGAWMTNLVEMSVNEDGSVITPVISLCGNFTKPTETTPSLLTFDEFETFLHEFGHSLHGLFATGKYTSLSGTNVYHDFVELPSQIMENWATQKEFLDLFAVHYLTGEKMPQELIDKIAASQNYLAAYSNVRQLSYAMTDMAWHTITEPVAISVEDFERNATAQTQMLSYITGTAMSPSFTHVFSGGYAAGYYGYKWAEVLEADAFSLFEEKGIFDRESARSFRENVLSQGGREHPMTLYVRFRGHEPETKALIDKMLK